MKNLPAELQELTTEALLENPTFRAWARRGDARVPAGRSNVAEARLILLALHHDDAQTVPTAAERAADFAALTDRMKKAEARRRRPRASRRRLLPWLAAAGCLLLLLFTFLFRSAPERTRLATGNGELREVVLPDGTRVELHANSELTYDASAWSAGERSVRLRGIAYFDVQKAGGPAGWKAFNVAAGRLNARVLGTRFVINERSAGERVFLEEGQLEVSWPQGTHPAVMLAPAEAVVTPLSGAAAVVETVSHPARYLSWRSGVLTVDNRPLAEVVAELEAIYGISLRVAGAEQLNKTISSAGIPVDNQSVALRVLTTALGWELTERGANVYEIGPPD